MAEGDYADWLQRGRAHQWGERPVDAMLCFQRAAALAPDAADPRFLLGEVHWQLGNIGSAVAAWRDSARVAPAHLASQLALAEALLAVGDPAGAADAAATALALAPEDRAARVLHAVAALASERDRDALVGLANAFADDAGRLTSPVTGGTLARVLRHSPDAPGASDVLAALVPHIDSLAFALLAPMARESAAERAPASLRGARGAITRAALERPVAESEIDVLRELALTFGDRALASRHAEAALAFVPSGAPLRWPRRTAGAALRVAVLMPQDASMEARANELLQEVASRTRGINWTVLARDPSVAGLMPGATMVAIGPAPDATVAAALAATDPDLLIDLAGLSLSSAPLLALRPAAMIVGVALAPSHAPPLVDAIWPADTKAIADALAGMAQRIPSQLTSGLDAAALTELFTRAVAAHRAQQPEEARRGYADVLEVEPDHAPTLHLYAALLRDVGELDAATELLERAVNVAPGFDDARASAARLARDQGDLDRGVDLVDAGLERAPRSAALWRVRGELELARHDAAAAEAAFAKALAFRPTDAEAHYNLGVALQKQQRTNDAARAYQRALAFDAGFADAHFNLGVLFQQAGRTDAAVAAYRAVLARDPGRAIAYRNLGELLFAAGRFDEGLANFKRFEAQCPDSLLLAVQSLEACQYAADAAALERYLDGLRNERFHAADAAELTDALEQLLYLLLFFDVEPELVHRFARTYASTAPHVYGPPLPPVAPRRPGKLRIGYLSADLREHVMGKMMWQALCHHDRERFALHFYSLSAVRDAWTERFAGIADRFEVIGGLGDYEAAQRIAADDLDLLVDLSGHTQGSKPGVLALKPARVQLTHVASAGSVGLDSVDFKLTDAHADLPENQQWMVERLLPMAGCVYPYRHIEPAASYPIDRATLGLAADAVVIGVFVTPLKLSRRCLALWREVLERVPRARLAFSPNQAALRPVFERLCLAAGIARDRLLFLPQGRGEGENQARYALVDFVLDPMPFGGVNGVLEPLDAGVPVVTLVGKRHGERSAYTILANLGVEHTVAQSGREYVELAVRLANDRTFAQSVRAAIQAGLEVSPLVDMVAHTRHLEAAYLEALRHKAPEVLAEASNG